MITINAEIEYLEKYIVGCICLDEKALLEAATYLTEDDFQSDQARAVFKSACSLVSKKQIVDPPGIISESKLLDMTVTNPYLKECMVEAPTTANVVDYAARLHECAEAIQLSKKLSTIAYSLGDGTVSLDQGRADAEQALQMVTFSDTDIVSAEEALNATIQEMKDIASGKIKPIASGFRKIDDYLKGGFKNGFLYIFGARPGSGKTTLAVNIADNIARMNRRVLFVSMEMPPQQLTTIRLQINGNMREDDLSNLEVEEVRKSIGRASDVIRRYPIDFNKPVYLTTGYIRKLAERRRYDVVIIDYLQLITPRTGKTQYERITAISRELKGLALELNVPVICLSQLNRGSADKEPRVYDLKDSGSIEQDADVVFLLHLLDRAEEGENRPSVLRLIIAKHRFGNQGKIDLDFYMDKRIIKSHFHGTPFSDD